MSEWIDVERETENKEKDNIWEPETVGESIQGIYIEKKRMWGSSRVRCTSLKPRRREENLGSTVLDDLMGRFLWAVRCASYIRANNPQNQADNPGRITKYSTDQ